MTDQETPGAVDGLLRAYIINQTSHWFIVGLIFPILILMVLDKGLTIFEAGTVLAIYSGTAVLLELPTGGLADSLGRKKVYIISVVVHGVGIGTFLFAFDYATIALAAFFLGLARALSSGSIDAWFVDEFKLAAPQGNLQQALARANIFIPLGLGLGSLIGGFLPMAIGGYLRDGLGVTIFSANLVVVLAADLIQIILTNALIKERAVRPGQGGLKEGFKQVPQVISTSMTYGVRNRTVLVLLLVMVAFGFGLSGLELLWQPRVSEIMGSETQTWVFGVLAAAYFMVTSVGSVLITPLCSRTGDDNCLVMTGLMLLLAFLVATLAVQSEVLFFATFYLLVYTVIGMTSSPYAALYNDEVPAEKRSTMLSFQSLVAQAGGLAGSIVLGYVAGSSGITAAWMVAAVVVASSSLGYFYLRARKKSSAGTVPSAGGGPRPPVGS